MYIFFSLKVQPLLKIIVDKISLFIRKNINLLSISKDRDIKFNSVFFIFAERAYYVYPNEKVNFQLARYKCRTKGQILPMPKTEDEYKNMKDTIGETLPSGYWLGLKVLVVILRDIIILYTVRLINYVTFNHLKVLLVNVAELSIHNYSNQISYPYL